MEFLFRNDDASSFLLENVDVQYLLRQVISGNSAQETCVNKEGSLEREIQHWIWEILFIQNVSCLWGTSHTSYKERTVGAKKNARGCDSINSRRKTLKMLSWLSSVSVCLLKLWCLLSCFQLHFISDSPVRARVLAPPSGNWSCTYWSRELFAWEKLRRTNKFAKCRL